MTALLASVTSPTEATLALNAGVDILDLKNPADGALGRLPLSTVRQIVTAIGGRLPVSATVGDPPQPIEQLTGVINHYRQTGIDYIKVGLIDTDSVAALQPLTSHTRLIAVLFADRRLPFATVLPQLQQAGFTGAMIDTFDKHQGRLRDWLSDVELADFVGHCRELRLLSGLAGSLGIEDIDPLLAIGPDYLGFRGALCNEHHRQQQLNPAALDTIRQRIPSLLPQLATA